MVMRFTGILLVATWLATGCDDGGCSSTKHPLPAPAADTDEYPEDYKLFLSPEIDEKSIVAQLKETARATDTTLEMKPGEPKCRRVTFLDTRDAEPAFRKRALSLRLREQRDGSCNKQNERLAISFNCTATSRTDAIAVREEMTLADGLGERNTKDRYKLRHVMRGPTALDRWVVGGTVRRLDAVPRSTRDILRLFPQLRDIDADQLLWPVDDRHLFETNHDVGYVRTRRGRARIEIATISTARDDRPGTPLATELSVELESCCDLDVAAFVRAVAASFATRTLDIEARDDLLYP